MNNYNHYNNHIPKLRYFLYTRKSSEDKNKQVASIPAQIKELKAIALREHVEIVDVLTEERSAKAPGRTIFNKMIERIHKGEANAILCWKLDRLSRNPVDGGTISWLIQQGIVQNIKTHSRDYYPTDNVLMMQVELGMANQFIRDLSDNTKRGLRKRVEDGWYPGKAPIGYINSEGVNKSRVIKFDTNTKPLVEKIFKYFLSGTYSVQRIRDIAVYEWGIRSIGGKKVSKSTIHRTLTNPFYCGEFEYPKGSGFIHKGKHPPLITKKEHQRIIDIIENRSRPRRKIHTHAYTGLIKCGVCGCSITADPIRTKYFKSTSPRHYKYYHCTKKSEKPCDQKAIEEKELEMQISEVLENIDIPPEVSDWLVHKLKVEKDKRYQETSLIVSNLQNNYNISLKKIDKLVDTHIEGRISEEVYDKKLKEYEKEKDQIKIQLEEVDETHMEGIESLKKAFSFAKNIKLIWENGSDDTKKTIILNLGSNLLLKDRKVFIELRPEMLIVAKHQKNINTIFQRIVPMLKAHPEMTLEDFEESKVIWGGRWDSNP